MGNGNPMKAGDMKAGCGLRTLRIFGNIRWAAPGYAEIASSTEAAPESAAAGSWDTQEFLPSALPGGGSLPAGACRRMPPRVKLPKRPHAASTYGIAPARRARSLDPLRAVGAVQAGAAVGAEVVAGLYVDHRVSAHGAIRP